MDTDDGLPIPDPIKPDLAYRALRKCTVKISKSNLDPTQLATALFSEEIIPETLHRDIKDKYSNRNSSERIEDIMEHIRECCKHRGQDFATFITVIRDLGERDLANHVIQKYKDLEKEDPPASIPVPVSTNVAKKAGPLNVRKLTRVINDVFNSHYAGLHDAVAPSLETFAIKLGSQGLLSKSVRDKPSYSHIMQEFLAVFQFFRKLEEFQDHCAKFFRVLNELAAGQDGPTKRCTSILAEDLKDAVSRELKIDFVINYED